MRNELVSSLVSDSRAIAEIVLAAFTIGALPKATELLATGPVIDAAISVLVPAVVLLRAAEKFWEMWRKYHPGTSHSGSETG